MAKEHGERKGNIKLFPLLIGSSTNIGIKVRSGPKRWVVVV
jgi:hypothetical protein